MTLAALEKVLYDLGVQGSARKAYSAEPQAFLGCYNLADDEQSWVREFRIGRLLQAGVNPMLTLGFWMFLHPSHSMAKYSASLTGGSDRG